MTAELHLADDQIQPFWQRMPEIFSYGMKPGVLASMAAIAVGVALAAVMPGIIGLLIYFVTLSSLYKFCYEILNSTARGNLEPPEGLMHRVNPGIFWSQLMLWFLLWLAIFASFATLPFVLATLIAVAIVFCIPAITMILAIDQNVFAALNPATWSGIISRVGKSYFILVFFLFLLMVSWGQAATLAETVFGTFFGFFIASCINVYFMAVMFHLMGYVVYQCHEDLGLEADEEGKGIALKDQAHPALRQARTLMAEGQVEEARRVLNEALTDRLAGIEIHAQYHKLLKITGDTQELTKHATQYTYMLINDDNENEALKVMRAVLQGDSEFSMPEGEITTRLAQRASDMGDHLLTLRLLNGYAKRYPGHADIPSNYLTIARILCERQGKDEQALKLLKKLKQDYQDHSLAAEIESYLATVQSMVGTG